MRNFLLRYWYPRWLSRNLYWGLGLFMGALLLVPEDLLGKASSLFMLGTWLLGLIAWSALAFHSDRFSRLAKVGPALLLLVLAQGLAVIFSEDLANSLNLFSVQLALFLLFLLAFLLARHERSVRPVLVLLFILGTLIAWYGIYQHVSGLAETYQRLFSHKKISGPWEQEIANRLLSYRAFSVFTYPNLFAGFLAALLPVTFSLLLTTPKRWQVWIFGSGAATQILGIYASGSFGGWLIGALGLGVFFFCVNPKEAKPLPAFAGKMWVGGAILALAGAILVAIARGPMQLYLEALARCTNWIGALHMGWDHLLFGVGLGQFGVAFPDYQPEQGQYVRYAHNFLLQYLAETGIVGLAALLWFLHSAAWQYARCLRQVLPDSRRIIALGLGIGAGIYMLHSLIDLDLDFIKTRFLFWFMLGSALGLLAPKQRSAVLAPAPFGSVVRWGLGCIGILVLWKGGKSLPVEMLLFWLAGLLMFFFMLSRLDSLASWPQLFKRIPLRWSLSALFVWAVLAAMVSPHPAGAIPGLSLGLAALMIYALLVLTQGSEFFFLRILTLGSLGLALAALFQTLLHPAWRAAAGWPNPNLLAAFLAIGFFAYLVLAIFAAPESRTKMYYSLGAGAVFLALLSTGSMAGLANALAGMLLLLLWFKPRYPQLLKVLWPVLAVMLLLAVLLPLATGNRLRHLSDYAGQAYERLHIARSAVDMILEHPMTGIGPGNFSYAFERFSFPNIRGLAQYGKLAEFAHNELLQLVAVIGIPGGLLLLWLLSQLFGYWQRQWRLRPGQVQEIEANTLPKLVAWSALAGALVQSCVDFNWHPPALLVWYMLLLGIALSPLHQQRPDAARILWDREAWQLRLKGLAQEPLWVLFMLLMLVSAVAATRPFLSEYLFNLGNAYRYKQDLKAADTELQKALSIHPFSDQAFDRLGQIRVDLYAMVGSENWFQLAEWSFKRALELNNLDPFIHKHLGTLYGLRAGRLPEIERQQEFDRAEEQYWLAIGKAPHHAPLYFELGNLLRDAGRMEAAERAWQQAIELEPHYAAALSNLGAAKEMRGDLAGAEKAFFQALQSKDLLLGAQGKYELELLSLNWAVVHYNLGYVYEKEGRWQAARKEYQTALTMEPDNVLAKKRLRNLKKALP